MVWVLFSSNEWKKNLPVQWDYVNLLPIQINLSREFSRDECWNRDTRRHKADRCSGIKKLTLDFFFKHLPQLMQSNFDWILYAIYWFYILRLSAEMYRYAQAKMQRPVWRPLKCLDQENQKTNDLVSRTQTFSLTSERPNVTIQSHGLTVCTHVWTKWSHPQVSDLQLEVRELASTTFTVHPWSSLTFMSVVHHTEAQATKYLTPLYSVSRCYPTPVDKGNICEMIASLKQTPASLRFPFLRSVSDNASWQWCLNPGVSPPPTPLCVLAVTLKQTISVLPLAWIQLARPGLIDGAARRTPSQLVILININVNNTQTACWRTNKHVNNASTRSDVLDWMVIGGEGRDAHTHIHTNVFHLRNRCDASIYILFNWDFSIFFYLSVW